MTSAPLLTGDVNSAQFPLLIFIHGLLPSNPHKTKPAAMLTLDWAAVRYRVSPARYELHAVICFFSTKSTIPPLVWCLGYRVEQHQGNSPCHKRRLTGAADRCPYPSIQILLTYPTGWCYWVEHNSTGYHSLNSLPSPLHQYLGSY